MVSVNTYDTGVVLEVEEDTVEALPGLGLADDDGGVDLLAELGLALLDGGHDHVADTTSGETVETSTDTLDGDDVEVTGTGVVRAVHDGTAIRVAMLAIHSCLGFVVRAFRVICGCTECRFVMSIAFVLVWRMMIRVSCWTGREWDS